MPEEFWATCSSTLRSLNLFSAFTQDFRPGLLAVALLGLVLCAPRFVMRCVKEHSDSELVVLSQGRHGPRPLRGKSHLLVGFAFVASADFNGHFPVEPFQKIE